MIQMCFCLMIELENKKFFLQDWFLKCFRLTKDRYETLECLIGMHGGNYPSYDWCWILLWFCVDLSNCRLSCFHLCIGPCANTRTWDPSADVSTPNPHHIHSLNTSIHTCNLRFQPWVILTRFYEYL